MNASTSQEVFAGPYLTAAGPEVWARTLHPHRHPLMKPTWMRVHAGSQAQLMVWSANPNCLKTEHYLCAGATEVQRRVHRHDGGVPCVPAVPAGDRSLARPSGAPVHPLCPARRGRAEQGRHEGTPLCAQAKVLGRIYNLQGCCCFRHWLILDAGSSLRGVRHLSTTLHALHATSQVACLQ